MISRLYRSAFTLIELLVVLAVILLLAGLLLATMSLVRESAEALETRQRIQTVESRLLALGGEDAAAVERLITEVGGVERRWASLRQCLERLVREHGLRLDQKADWAFLPPHLATVYDPQIGCFEEQNGKFAYKWRQVLYDSRDGIYHDGIARRQPTLDNVILWRIKRDFMNDIGFMSDDDAKGHGEAYGTPPYTARVIHSGNLDGHDRQTYIWWHRALRPVAETDERWCWTYSHTTPLEEGLDSTAELLVDQRRPTDWYLEQWPVLSETLDGEELVQHAWPDSDWDRADPGSVAPVWEAPFGRPIIERRSGELGSQTLHRSQDDEGLTLADFSPLASARLLQAVGVIPPGASDGYRGDRTTDLGFNDRWGNPLIVVSGVYLAPRYDLDPAPVAEASHQRPDGEFANDLLGGRDYLRRRGLELYGYSRAVHLAVGALGPHRGVFGDDNPIDTVIPTWEDTVPLTWIAEQDDEVLRAAWLQIRELCDARRYTSTAAQSPPWTGIERGERQRWSSFLGAPLDLH